MIRLLVFALLVLTASASHATGNLSFSLAPLPVFPGQPAYLRIDDSTGCFHVEGQSVKRADNEITVTLHASDFFQMPCPPNNVTPLYISLGTLETGNYSVRAEVCVGLAVPGTDPCYVAARFTLGVGNGPVQAPARIPALGIVALLLSCSGIFALAFTGLRGPSRR